VTEEQTSESNGRLAARVGELDHRPRRLLKTWQEAELVRGMDAVILAAGGAYADRSEFIAEALRDRIEAEEERVLLRKTPHATPSLTTAESEPSSAVEGEAVIFADWAGADPPNLPRAAGPDVNFGLHNRDYPTLWAADWLGRLTVRAEGPISWRRFLNEISPRAWEQGRVLAAIDLDRPPGNKLAAGFPTNLKKRESAESRFRSHVVGVASERGNQGPLFVFGLVGLDGADDDALTALSPDGLALIERLAAAGIADGPPFAPNAWIAFAAHLESHAAKELETWLKVLAIVAEEPDRTTLIERCDWWSGTTADTNAMSYVARGREWGLVEPRLINGRYRLTDLGRHQLEGTPDTVMERT
jgi:Arc/MetJ-type ribon-helix-helix transcriptional regulator